MFASAVDDKQACAFARLMVWTDPAALSAVGPGATEAYRDYDRNWRTGRKRPQDWPTSWAVAMDIVQASASQPEHTTEPELDLPARLARLEREIAALKGGRKEHKLWRLIGG